MISWEVLVQTARRGQTTELNVAREYCQHLFLGAFYREHGSERVMFKGGTALRIIYGSPRFSEDLDFSGFRTSVAEIEDYVAAAAAELERNAIPVSLAESKKTSGGYLAILTCRVRDLPVQIQVEVSLRRRNDVKGRGVLVTPELLPAYVLTQLPEELLVKEKLEALMTRGKPRDYFDLYFMLRKGLVSAGMKGHLLEAKDALLASKLNFGRDLGPFLPRSSATVGRDLRKALLEELRRHGL
ncbi:MAG TPA: nucleotidyl transferase AbiEii/AbiGii toxin family protein [Anaerolineales bacterium]|nr:nucleotidyl transferase AbiEii/AbiGii toxin family protein [Anaerolineales bacterium]